MASDIIVTSLNAIGGLGQVSLAALWQSPAGMSCLSYMQAAKVEFYRATVNSFGSASKVGESAIGVITSGGLAAGTTYYFWARAVDAEGNVGAVYPAGGGVAATTLTATPGPGSIGTAQLADNAVTTTKVANAAITNAQIGSVSADKLTAGTVNVTVSFSSPIINGGSITGVTVTGGVIRTSASGPRGNRRGDQFS